MHPNFKLGLSAPIRQKIILNHIHICRLHFQINLPARFHCGSNQARPAYVDSNSQLYFYADSYSLGSGIISLAIHSKKKQLGTQAMYINVNGDQRIQSTISQLLDRNRFLSNSIQFDQIGELKKINMHMKKDRERY